VPLETASYISDLVTSNPAASDGMNNADDHMRLIKSAVKATFPSITGAVTATHTDLNNAAAFLAGTVVCKVPLGTVGAPSYSFIGDLDTGFWSPGANQISGSVGGARWFTVGSDKAVTFDGKVTVTGAIAGPGSVPIGGMIMWLDDTLPSGFGTWCWANGGTLSRTTVGAGKELFDVWGTRYGAGDGSTTFNVINMQEVSPIGKTGMGGATSPGLLASITLALRNTLGGIFGSDTNTLALVNTPEHDHAVYLKDPGHTHTYTAPDSNVYMYYQAGSQGSVPSTHTTSSSFTNITIGSVSGTANDNKTAKAGQATPTPVNNVQPGRAVNFIIRVA
jgi:microcystin-dependent protein